MPEKYVVGEEYSHQLADKRHVRVKAIGGHIEFHATYPNGVLCSVLAVITEANIVVGTYKYRVEKVVEYHVNDIQN